MTASSFCIMIMLGFRKSPLDQPGPLTVTAESKGSGVNMTFGYLYQTVNTPRRGSKTIALNRLL